jgi:hypothetical protein
MGLLQNGKTEEERKDRAMTFALRHITAMAGCAALFAPALLLVSDGSPSLALYTGLSGNLAVLLVTLLPQPVAGIR